LGRVAVIAIALLGLWTRPAPAAEQKIVLRLSDFFPSGARIPQYTAQYFMKLVQERTDDAVTFEYYPAEQLGKARDLMQLTLDGVTDIGLVDPSYVSDKLPLGGVAELPGMFQTACGGTRAFWKLATGDGLLVEKELAPAGLRVLFVVTQPPYQLLTRRKIEQPKDISGLKLRTSGGAMDVTVRKLGGVPVRITGPDTFQALSRGTIDGAILPMISVISYQLADLIKFTTVGENFGDLAIVYMISEKRWRALPPNVQEVLRKAGEDTTAFACQTAEQDNGPALDQLKQHGVQVIEFDASAKEEIRQATAPTAVDWARALDARGKAGSEVLKAFQAAVREQDVARSPQ
jgi:TRAP-type C4-dicarboxylate transport system substrate-binding protein